MGAPPGEQQDLDKLHQLQGQHHQPRIGRQNGGGAADGQADPDAILLFSFPGGDDSLLPGDDWSRLVAGVAVCLTGDLLPF